MKTKLLLLTLFINALSFAQYTAIPDANFENALSAYDNIANDGQVPTANISSLTSLNVSSQNISDLTGIQDFTALKTLNCKTNNLTSLNVLNNLNLRKLYCSNNQLTTINTSANTLLTHLYCDNNLITSLDVSLNTNLIRLYCNNNQITNLNTATNTNLLRLYCQNNQIGTLNISTNTLLKYLYCQNNQLTALNTSLNPDLLRIYCNTNQISSLDVSANTALLYLYCHANQLTTINTNTNIQLQRLYCYSNQITSLNTSNNVNLVRFYCNSNSLTALDVSANTSLTYLRCQNNQINNLILNPATLIELNTSSNQLTTIDVSAHTNLQNLYLHVNQFTDLDVSNNVNLVKFYCQSNQLTKLNVQNGNNTNITLFKAFNNSNLTCIEVDNVAYSTTNWTQIDPASSFSLNCHYGETFVPDNNFEAYLETHDANGTVVPLGDVTSMGNGIANDDYVTTSHIDTVTNLNITSLSIADLTGIEDFVALQVLYCGSNQLINLDVSQNVALQNLNCGDNQLTTLDTSTNPLLSSLTCNTNQLTSLNINSNTALTYLHCSNNPLGTLNLSNNTNLTHLLSTGCQLTALDVSTNLNLQYIACDTNSLTTLDVSINSSLNELYCQNNQLTSLNVKNGNNTNFIAFHATNNPNLLCIEVDNVAYSTTNWTNIDAASTFNTHCPLGETFVPDNNFEAYLETHDANGTVVPLGDVTSMGNGIANDDYVTTSRINTVGGLSIPNLNIADMTGIEDFVQLTYLHCYQNQINNLDVSNNVLLTQLLCNSNQIPSLDLSQNTALQSLWCFGNQLTILDLSQNVNMVQLLCNHNQISTLDLSTNTALTQVRCHNNNMTSLNVKNGNNTNFTTFQSDNNPNLLCIEVDNVAYSTTNWTNIDVASTFSTHCPLGETYVPDNNFEAYLETHNASGVIVPLGDPTSMGNGIANDDYVTTSRINTVLSLNIGLQGITDITGIEDFTLLESFLCANNLLGSFDISQNTQLKLLQCANTSISNLNVSQNTLLETLSCTNNQLVSIDLTNNLALQALYCRFNQLTGLDVSVNTNLTIFHANNNSALTTVNVQNGNNTNFTIFNTLNTPNLLCIQVDSPIYSTTNWADVDPASTFSNNCPSTCSHPTSLSASTPTATGATLAWQENGAATVWDLEIGIQGFIPTGTATQENVSNPYIWTGGIPNTNYDFYVRADCSGNNTVTSAWEGPFTFSTLILCETDGFTLDNTTPFNGVMKSAIAFADVDGDNDQDVLITGATTTNQEIAELYTNNAGVFTLVAGTPFTGVSDGSVAFADVDNDGDQDVVITGRNAGSQVINLYLNNGSGVFTLDASNTFSLNGFASLAFADVDANGFQDLVITGYASTSLYKNTGGTFTLDATTSFQALGKSATDFADVDGDGDQDLLISGGNAGYHTKLYINNGAGVFTLSAQAFQGVFRGDNEFADIDNDGDQDVLITGYNGGTYYANLYSNNGLGVFSLIAGTPFDPMFASSVAFGDMDSDGDKDLIMSGLATGLGRITKLYDNDGTGTFTEVLGTPFDGTDSGSLAFADIDNDFDLDILITGQNTASVRIAKLYLNNTYYNTNYTTTGWTNGTPTLNKCAVIDDDLSITNFSARKLTVNATLTVAANSYIQIKKDIINNVMLRVEPTGSVVQIDDTSTVTGAGDFQTNINTTNLDDRFRFTYFSSPSATETLNVFSSWADMSYLWEFNETIQDWDYITNTATPMQAGNGYIVRGNNSNSYPIFIGQNSFQNAYNNGVITRNLHFKGDGSPTANLDNDSNLVGNPYPCAINGIKLLNPVLNPTAGTLYFWTHNTTLVGGVYSSDDYAMWNLSGGTAAISGGIAPTGYIASGQGFFMEAEGDETITAGQEIISTLTFNNDMRETGNNTDFRRPTLPTDNKIWLNLANNQGVFNQMLVAFLPNTTNSFDTAYDGRRSPNDVAIIYSIDQNNQYLGIQALPVLADDTVIPLGYNVANENITSLTISIDHLENMQNFTIYLRDNLLNRIHNLSDTDYVFTVSETGIFNTRFELLFRTSTLSETDYVLSENLIVSNTNNVILVKTTNGSIINKLEVYDILGKQILNKQTRSSEYRITKNINQGTILFIKATLENGSVLNKKIIKL